MLNVLDEFGHECLAIRIARKLKATDVIDVLSDLFILRGIPAHIRSDNGPEFVAKVVQEWIAIVGANPAAGRTWLLAVGRGRARPVGTAAEIAVTRIRP
jgi:transposase InsO family protein